MGAKRKYLYVPKEFKDLAKELGCKWDADKRQWYYWQNDDKKIDIQRGNKMRIIADWLPKEIREKNVVEYKYKIVRWKDGEEIMRHFGYTLKDLHLLDSRDSDMDGSIMIWSEKKRISLFFPYDVLHDKLNEDEYEILTHWLSKHRNEIH